MSRASSLVTTPFPLLIERHVEQHPDADFAHLAAAGDHAVPIEARKVSWSDLHGAVLRAAHILNPLTQTGVPTRSGRVIALLAITDALLYQTLNLAIVRSGNIALPISHRNTAAAVANLLRKTDCHDVILAGGSAISSLFAETQTELVTADSVHAVNVIEPPSAELLYPDLVTGVGEKDTSAVLNYPTPPDINNLDAIRFYLHSSGTTSLPKPIPIDERYLRYLGSSPIVVDQANGRLNGVLATPPFHLVGFIMQILVPLYSGATILLWDITPKGQSIPIPTPETVLHTFLAYRCSSTIVVPNFLVAWAQNEEAIKCLLQMDYVMTGGGPLPDEVGDYLVARGVKIVLGYGGTEFGVGNRLIPNIRSEKEWAWLEFASDYPVRWLEHSIDKQVLYELQILASNELRPGILNTETPSGPAYSTSDLFMAHPTKPGLFKIVGRLDDQVTLATGEKVNPTPIELTLTSNPIIRSAILVGRAQNQVGVIIEIAEGFEVDPKDDGAVAKFRNMIWPTVEGANINSAGFARIFKETIIPSVPHKPFQRTPKGSIRRKQTIESYEEEIEQMYAAVEKAKGGDHIPLPDSWARTDVVQWLAILIQELVQHPIEVGNDLFEQGADSLTATFLRNRIVGAMKRSTDPSISSKSQDVDPNIVFTYPTATLLAGYIASFLSSSDVNLQDSVEEHIRDMNLLLQRYTTGLPITRLAPMAGRPEKETVLITGTTGALGSLMLAFALEDERIERVWAVNRRSLGGQTIAERHRASFIDKALDFSLLESEKVRFVEAELGANKLGLQESLYNEIRDTTTLVIHNAWRLDFNLSVNSFESHIKGTRHLVDLALSSSNASSIRFIFTSSVGTLFGWPDASSAVPEEPITDPRISVSNGYGESKYVTEKLLEAVNAQTGLTTTSIRIGQLSGSRNGFWSSTDWVPIILASSVQLGCLPDARGSVSWIPLDGAASSVLDVGLAQDATTQRVVHLYHPRPIPWTEVMTKAAEGLIPITNDKPLPLIPWSEWFGKLESYGAKDMNRIPALKLLPFYRRLAAGDSALRGLDEAEAAQREALGFVKIGTTKMQVLSSTLRDMPPLDSEDPVRWVSYWTSKGLFQTSP